MNSLNGMNVVISTHILTKRMTSSAGNNNPSRTFQLTSSRRGWPSAGFEDVTSQVFQLTSSRRGWQYKETLQACLQGISTHILTKRMTWKCKVSVIIRSISTHILTKRMTIVMSALRIGVIFQLTSSRRGWHCFHHSNYIQKHFNSHPHEEDDCVKKTIFFCHNISTHILTKRMTTISLIAPTSPVISTHILTKRMTRFRAYVTSYRQHFNSHPHEEDDSFFLPV